MKTVLQVLKDPLFHFIILGALIYLAYDFSPKSDFDEKEPIVIVTKGEIDWFKSTWESKWSRPPTKDELNGLIEQHIKETVLYREALAMGLDENDVVIRRRLAQKVEFLTNDLLQPSPPSEEELSVFFEKNMDRYAGEDLITLTHVFFDPDQRGNATLEDAAKALSILKAESDLPLDFAKLGDRFLLQSYLPQRPKSEIAKLFGSRFAEPVFQLQPETWHGPVLSGYGTHLVYVHELVVPPQPRLDEVREELLLDWANEKRAELNEEFVDQLVKRYKVVIENEPETAQSHAAAGNG
ncbi:hypothetical protein LP7551_03887 [Roseibium album]|nr:hypothetical protein LP7551_03887 [Roseibium album]